MIQPFPALHSHRSSVWVRWTRLREPCVQWRCFVRVRRRTRRRAWFHVVLSQQATICRRELSPDLPNFLPHPGEAETVCLKGHRSLFLRSSMPIRSRILGSFQWQRPKFTLERCWKDLTRHQKNTKRLIVHWGATDYSILARDTWRTMTSPGRGLEGSHIYNFRN